MYNAESGGEREEMGMNVVPDSIKMSGADLFLN